MKMKKRRSNIKNNSFPCTEDLESFRFSFGVYLIETELKLCFSFHQLNIIVASWFLYQFIQLLH